jgi:phosphomevalonate kinase
MLNAIQQGVLTSSTKQRLDELENTKSELEISILQEQMQKPLFTKEQLTFWIHRFRKTDITSLEQRQRLIDIFVNTVYVFDNHLVITFNYKDGTKSVTLGEVEKAGLGSDLKGFGVPCRVVLQELRFL